MDFLKRAGRIFSVVGIFVLGFFTLHDICADESGQDISNMVELFSEIAPGIYRGAQPGEDAFPKLKEFGIKTVVNFRHEEDKIAEEAKWVRAAGMSYASLPWTIFKKNDPEVMKQFFSILEGAENRPVFFHCRRGAERTSIAAVLYRMKYEGKSNEEACRLEIDPFPVRLIWKPFVKSRLKEFEEALRAGKL